MWQQSGQTTVSAERTYANEYLYMKLLSQSACHALRNAGNNDVIIDSDPEAVRIVRY